MRVRTGQSVLAVTVVVSVIPALAIGLPSGLGGLFFLTAMPAAIPLFLRREPQRFVRACVIIGTALLTWAVVGFILGMFLFIPASVMLLVAAFVDPRTRPDPWWGLGALGAPLVAGVVLAGFMTSTGL